MPTDGMAEKVLIGKVRHFYSKVGVAAIELTGDLAVGDRISIEQDQTAFEQEVTSMQIEHESVTKASSGDSVGIKTERTAGEGSRVYRLV